jgi:hypothetical protein
LTQIAIDKKPSATQCRKHESSETASLRLKTRLGIVMFLTPTIKYLWAAPATAIGLCAGACAVVVGARFAVHTGVVEISLSQKSAFGVRLAACLPFSAITFGHVVLAKSEPAQHALRRHERMHVAQYERWGPLFLIAYPVESLLQLLRGRRPYFDNRFEVVARAGERQIAARKFSIRQTDP